MIAKMNPQRMSVSLFFAVFSRTEKNYDDWDYDYWDKKIMMILQTLLPNILYQKKSD